MKNSDRQNRYQQAFVPNGRMIFNIPLGGKILSGKIVIQGTVVLSAVGSDGTQLEAPGPVRLIKRVIFRANPAGGSRYPGGEIIDAYPSSLLRYAITQRNGKYFADQGGQTFAAGVAGTYPVYLSIPIYWADANLRRQVMTSLNADPSAYQDLQLEVQTADITNVFTGWAGTAVYNLNVMWVDDRENFAGDTYVVFQEDHDLLIPATALRYLDNAMPQDGAFTSWDLFGLQSAQQTLSDGLLNRVVIDGDSLDYDKYAQDIRQQDFDDEWFDPSLTATGLYHVDFTDGLVGGSIGAPQVQAKFDLTNVSGANLDLIRFFTRRLFAPVGYQPAGGPGSALNG